MTWFKVDDKLHDHRKARAAGAAAMGVWCLSGSWSADNLTDGFIPSTVLSRWGKPRDAARLVQVGLWFADEQDGEKGWRFHEWHERQPSRAQKLEERAQKAEAGRIGGLQSGRSRREAQAKQRASGPVEPPTRPDPTRPTDADASVSGATAPRETGPPPRFDEFWETYSKKVGRTKAETAYRNALKKPGVTPDLLIATAAAYITWQVTEGKHPAFTKDATTWLHGEHWRDERTPTLAPASNVQRHLQLAAELAEREQGPRPPTPLHLGGAS